MIAGYGKQHSLCFYHNISVKENFYNKCQNFRSLIETRAALPRLLSTTEN